MDTLTCILPTPHFKDPKAHGVEVKCLQSPARLEPRPLNSSLFFSPPHPLADSLFQNFLSAKTVMIFFRLDLTLLRTSRPLLCLPLLGGVGSCCTDTAPPSCLHARPCDTGLTSCRLLSLLPSLTAASFLPATLEVAAKCLLTPL